MRYQIEKEGSGRYRSNIRRSRWRSLEALIDTFGRLPDELDPLIKFVRYGYSVDIDGMGNVSISEHTTKTNMSSSDDSGETITAEIEHRESAIKKAGGIIAARNRPFLKRLDGLLKVVCEVFQVDSGTLSYATDESYVFEAVDVADRSRFTRGYHFRQRNNLQVRDRNRTGARSRRY